MLGTHPSVRSACAPLGAIDEASRATAEILCDRLRRLRALGEAFSACGGPEDVRRALPAALELIPARMVRLIELQPGGAIATAVWPDAARDLPPGAHAAAPAHRALVDGAPVWLEGAQAIAASVDLGAAAAALGIEAWGAIPLAAGKAVLELGVGAPPPVDATGRAYLATAASLVGGALLGAASAERADAAADLERRARAELAELNAAFEALAAGFVLASTSGEIERVNRAGMDLLAIDESERDGIRWVHQLLERLAVEWPDGRRVRMAETPFARARGGEAVRDLLMRVVPPGQPSRWIHASAVPLGAPGAVPHVAITLVDVTRRRELEQEQRDLVREMFERVTPPIRSLREQARRILTGAAKGPDDASAVAREISRAARRVEAALREIESALRFDSRALAASPELVDVKAFVLDLLEHLGAEPDVGRVMVSASPGLRKAYVDPDHLERMLVELVRGALAGSEHKTDVLVACAAAEGAVRITVSANGQDVAPEDLHRIFDRFFRARGRPPGRLYAVRLLAEANRGRVLAEGGPQRGLAIHVELPTRAR